MINRLTHTLVARTSESDCSSHPRSPWIPVVLIWLIWLGFMFTVNQNTQQTQGHRVLQRIQQRRQSDAFPFKFISLHSDEVMTYRALYWYLISPNTLLQYCVTVYILYIQFFWLIFWIIILFFVFFFHFSLFSHFMCSIYVYIVKKCFYNFCCALLSCYFVFCLFILLFTFDLWLFL